MIESVDQLPAALRPREFKVGDRVRVLPRPECSYCYETHDQEVGMTGTVTGVGHSGAFHEDEDPGFVREATAHPYWVRFDRTLPDPSPHAPPMVMNHFAHTELEPLGDES